MTPEDFARYAARTRMRERALRMAGAVLIEGIGPSEAARREGQTHEAARRAAARIVREMRQEGGYPRGWEAVTVIVPQERAEMVRRIEQRERRKAGLLV